MPHLTRIISPPNGPTLDVGVWVSEHRRKLMGASGVAIPAPIPVRVLVDTGARSTCLDLGPLGALGLVPSGTAQIQTASTGGTPVEAPVYDVSIVLLHKGQKFIRLFPVVQAIGVSLAGQGIQGLVGRDILSECLFIYDGPSGTFTFAF